MNKLGDRCKQVAGSKMGHRGFDLAKLFFFFTSTYLLSPITFLLTYLLSPTSWLHASNPGATIMPVLVETRSVRSTALGKTFVTNSKNVSAVFENPVGLYTVRSPQIAFFYNRSYADVGFGYLAFAYPFKNFTVGFGILNMQTDTFDTIIGEEAIERSFIKGMNDWVYCIGTGITLSKWFYTGFNIKQYNSRFIEKYTARGTAYDCGVKISAGHFNFGFSLNNYGAKSGYTENKFNIPTQLQFGINYLTKRERFFHNFSFAVEYEKRIYEEIDFLHAGIEWELPVGWIHPFENILFRTGYLTDIQKNKSQKFSFGFGIELGSVLLEYSFVPHTKLGTSHLFSITYEFLEPPTEIEEPT